LSRRALEAHNIQPQHQQASLEQHVRNTMNVLNVHAADSQVQANAAQQIALTQAAAHAAVAL